MRQVPAWQSYDRMAANGDLEGVSGALLNEAGELSLSEDAAREAEFFRSALSSRERVLDLGCGNGFPLVVLADCVSVICGLDASPSMLVLAGKNAAALELRNVSLVRGLGERLPFRDSTFDGFAVSGALESVADPAPVLCEMARVSKPEAIVANLEQDFRSRLREGREREERYLRAEQDRLVLQIRRYLTEPYRICDERYILDPSCGIARRARASLRLVQDGRCPTDLRPEDVPTQVIQDAYCEMEAQFDPGTLREAFARAGFQTLEQQVMDSYGVPHIFTVCRRG